VPEKDRRDGSEQKESGCRSVPGKSIVVEALVTSAYLFNSVLDTSTATTLSVMKTFRLFFVLVFGISLFLFAADKPEEKLKPPMELKYPDDFVASSARLQPEIKVDNSDLVFVGYGVVAPEYGWDDYKGVDVRGKTILMLINDPAVPDPKDPSKLDEKMFKGKAMTYYGRWTYKYEIAAQKGAAAAIIIHETVPAAYQWQVVKSSWAKENFELDNPNTNMDAVAARSWITLDVAKKLLADCGQ